MSRLIRTVSWWRCFETSGEPYPGLLFTFRASFELLRDGFGYKGAQWDATLRGYQFGPAKDRSGIWRVVFTQSGFLIYGR